MRRRRAIVFVVWAGLAAMYATIPMIYLPPALRVWGVGALLVLALAGVIALTGNALATCTLLQLRFRGLAVPALLASLARAVAIALPAEWLGGLVRTGLGQGWLGAAIDLAAGGAVFSAIVCGGVFSIGDAPMREALRRVSARLLSRRS